MRQFVENYSSLQTKTEDKKYTVYPARNVYILKMTTSFIKNSLKPLVNSQPRILILGTAPGELSLKHRKCYEDPKNQFWRILGEVYGEYIESAYEAKLSFVRDKHIALWDVLETFERKGSLDSSFKNTKPNNFIRFFQDYPSLRHIVFNGGKAQKLFLQLVQRDLDNAGRGLKYKTLPSTSSTPGKYVKTVEGKIKEWAILRTLENSDVVQPRSAFTV